MEDGNGLARVLGHVRPGDVLLLPEGVPEDGVHQARGGRARLFRDADGLVHRGERGDPVGEEELVEPRPEDVGDRRLQGGGIPLVEAGDDPVHAAPHPERPVDELGEKPPVMGVGDPLSGKRGVEEGFRIVPLLIDPVEDLDGEFPGGLLSFPFVGHLQ